MSRSTPDLKVGVVPVTNLEWIQKIHREQGRTGLLGGGDYRYHTAAYAGLH